MPPFELPTVCILAGGRGTRLGELTREIPKPLIEVAGKAFLEHQLGLLASHGARRAVLCVGYRGELIEQRLGSEYSGVQLAYSYDAPGLDGTLGAVRRALPLLGERFLVLYGDTYLRIPYAAVAEKWIESACPALMTVLHNEGRWDTSNAMLEGDRVVRYDKDHPSREMQWIDYGLGGLCAHVLAEAPADAPDLATLYRLLAGQGKLYGVAASERFFEIGSPAAIAETEAFLRAEAGPAE